MFVREDSNQDDMNSPNAVEILNTHINSTGQASEVVLNFDDKSLGPPNNKGGA